jgi:hypothetical protein
MDVERVEKQVNVTPAYGYPTWGGWYPYEPGVVNVDTYVVVKTSIYDVTTGELLFGATSRTANPADLQELVGETLNSVRKELQSRHMVPVS